MTPKEMTAERLADVRRDVTEWVHESAQVESYPGSALSTAERHARDLIAHIDALTARLEAAERERDEERANCVYQYSETVTQRARAEVAEAKLEAAERTRDASTAAFGGVAGKAHALQARAEAAEAKLAALVASVDRVAYQMGPPHSCPRKFAIGQLRSALAAARIKP